MFEHRRLRRAIESGDIVEVRHLLSKRPDLAAYSKDVWPDSPIYLASLNPGNNAAVLRLLLEKSDPSWEVMHHTLFSAVVAGSLEVVQALCSHSVNVNRGLMSGPPINIAAQRGRLDIVEALLEAGARADQTDSNGKTAIDHAVERYRGDPKRDAMIELLSRHGSTRGADPDRVAPGAAVRQQAGCVHHYTLHSVDRPIAPCDSCHTPFEVGGMAGTCTGCGRIVHTWCRSG